MNFSEISSDLLLGTTPSARDYDMLASLGVQMIINMRIEHRPEPDPHIPPMILLWLPSIDSFLFPISIRKLQRGARAALEVIRSGGRVYAHCAYGVHRAAAMGSCILIAQGYDPRAAMELVKTKRPQSDPFAFYIRARILKFAREWENYSAGRVSHS